MTTSLIPAVVIGSLLLPLFSGILGFVLRHRPAVADVVYRFTLVLLLALPLLIAATPRMFHLQKVSGQKVSGRNMNVAMPPVEKTVPNEEKTETKTASLPPAQKPETLSFENAKPDDPKAFSVSNRENQAVTVPALSLSSIVRFVWLLGAGGCLLILLRSYRNCILIGKSAETISEPGWNALCDELQKRFGIRNRVRLLHSPDIFVPQVVGLLRPVILLPTEVTVMPPNEGILIHELVHIKRHDVFWQILSGCVSGAYWFQPPVWFHAAAMRRNREEICDAHVLLGGVKGSDYAETLLDMSSRLQRGYALPKTASCAVTMSRNKPHLERRIRFLLDAETDRARISPIARTAVLAVLLGFFSLLVLLCPAIGEENENSPAAGFFGWNLHWNAGKSSGKAAPEKMNDRDFGYYFPKEQLYLADFADWHARCRSIDFLGLPSGKLHALRTDAQGNTASNEILFKISYAQILGGYFDEAAATLEMLRPKPRPGESLDTNMAQRHDVRKGDERKSEYYLKDRALRYLVRCRKNGEVDAAMKSAMEIFSVPERNDALLEIMRSLCQKSVDAGNEKERRHFLDKAGEVQSKIVGLSRDHGFGLLAVTYGKTGNRTKALETVERIGDPDVRQLALGWSSFRSGPVENPADSSQGDLAFCRLQWKECNRRNLSEDEKFRIRNEIRLAAQRLPASPEKFEFLCEIGNVFAYRDHAATGGILLSIFADIKDRDAGDPLVLDGILKILNSDYRFKNRSKTTWQTIDQPTEQGFHGLETETIEDIGQILIFVTKTKFAVLSRSSRETPPDDGAVFQALKHEPGAILKAVLPYYDLPEVAETIFDIDLRPDVLEITYADLYRCFRNPRSKGFDEPFYKSAKPGTKKYLLASLLPAFYDAPDFPWREYLDEIERTPGAGQCLRDRIGGGLRSKYGPHTPKAVFEERYESLEKQLGISIQHAQ